MIQKKMIYAVVSMLCLAFPLAAQQVVRMTAADQPLRREARTLFTVGVADGGPQAFGYVADVGFDGAENLYVLDRLNARVVVFDSTGRLIRTMGRQGGGPGEFSAPQQMAVTPAGEVIVSDVGRRALAIFNRDGSFARSVPYAGASLLIGGRLALHPRGGVVSVAMGNPARRDAGAFGEEVLLWTPTGTGDPRALLSISPPHRRQSGRGSITVHSETIFASGFYFGVLPDGGIAFADGPGWSIRILDTSGRISRVLERGIRPRPVTSHDREQEIERRERQRSEGGALRLLGTGGAPIPAPVRRSLAEQLRNAEFASVMPVITGIIVDPSGNLWVARSGPSLDRRGGIDVVTPAGRYLGTISGMHLPSAFSPRGRAAFVRTDELGIQRITVMRL